MSVSQQLKQQFDFLNNTPTTTLAPADIAAIQKAYGFGQPRQKRLSKSEREANLAMFNANLEEQSREMGKAFATNTSNLPAEARYRAWQDAQEAFKSQHANLSEEQQQIALSAFNEYADVFRQADEEAGFFSRTGDLLSYVPTTFTKLGEQAVGLVAPDSDLRKWFTETTADVENWRSDESKMRALQASDAMAQAKANGELGFTQFFANAAENPLETLGGFAESALPTVAAAAVGVAAAPVTGGTSLALPAIVGGVQGAGATRNEIYDHIKAMPQEQLNQSPEYQALLATGLSPEQARENLASSLIEHGGEVLATGLSSAALSQLGGLGRIGQAGKGVLGSTAGKFTSELLTEPTDEVFQQYMGNSAIHDIDQTHSLTDGLGEAAAGGLLFGAAGGAVAAADNAYRTPNATQVQANNDQAIDDVVNVQPEPQQAQTEQTSQPKSQVNGNVLESILSAYQNDEARFKELYEDLASDIQDSKLQQRLNEGDREYANLARAYLEQTGQLQPQQAVETPQNVANQPEQETQTAQTETIAPESVNRIDETQLQQYEQELNQLISEVQAGQITPNAITARYADIADRYPNHNELAAELSSRKQRVQEIENDPTLDDETKAEQVLYSRSPMKSVEANIKRGQERMTQAILDKADVKRGMYNQEFGWVDFVWGDDGATKGVNRFGEPRGRGLAHIYEARMRKDGLTEQQVTQMLTNDIIETIAKGTPKQSNRAGNERLELNYLNPNNGQTHRAILTRNKGSNSWLLTGFEVGGGATRPGSATSSPTHINRTHSRDDVVAPMYPNDPNKGRKANSNGERTVGYGTSTPTQNTPMRSRDNLGALEMHQQAGYGLNVHQSTQQRNRQIAQDQQTLSRILGEETASHIQVVDRNTKVPSSRDVKQLATKGVEGWFEPSTQKLYIISDNITANDVLSRDERLAWVAFHELAHAGVRIKYGHLLTNVLASASQNVVVKVLARKIQAEHGYEREIAIEEAMMEIYAAYETGNWAELESRYKTKIHESYKQGKNSVGDFLTRVANALRRLIGGIIGKDLTQTMTTSQVFETLRGIQQGINDIAKSEQNQTASENGDIRYSFAGKNAQNADKQSLGKAVRLDLKNTNSEDIRQKTGWFRGTDKKWRFEIDDSQASVTLTESEIANALENNKYYRLSYLLEHPQLFEAYPDLKMMDVIFDNSIQGGAFSDGAILIGTKVQTPRELKSLLLHEIQHAIQESENFARGASPGYFMRQGFDEETAYEKYIHSSGEVEARNVQLRMDMSSAERKSVEPFFTQDVHYDNEDVFYPKTGTAYSLNEDPNSEFAKAVDTVAQGGSVAGYVNVGTTPDVLKMLGLPDVKVTIHGSTFKKVMQDKHNVTSETLKQLPKQINDPVAVMKSAPQATQQGYVVLTELVEENPLTGQSEPVVSALHLKQDANGLEIINIASVYGKNLRGLQNMLNHDLLYWNNEKGTDVINTFGLQLPAYALRNQSLQSNIKTEADLSQYQSENSDNIRFSRSANYRFKKSDLEFNQDRLIGKSMFSIYKNDTLANLFNHSPLFEHFPELANTKVVKDPSLYDGTVRYDEQNDSLLVGNFTHPSTFKSAVENLAKEKIKSAPKVKANKQSSAVDDEYMELAKRYENGDHSVEPRLRELVDKSAAYWAKKSKIVDEEGIPIQVYHGTSAKQIKEFDYDRIGQQGTADGQGFYFANKEDFAKGYQQEGGSIVKGYLNIQNALNPGKITLTKANVKKLIQKLDPNGDGFLSNFGDVDYEGYNNVLNEAVNNSFDSADNDVDLIGGIINGEGSVERVYEALESIKGPSGVIAPKGDSDVHYVIGKPNQIKSSDLVTYDDDNNIIPLSKRFNSKSNDIRYSVKQSVDDLAKTGKAKQDASQMSKLRSFDGFKSLVKDVGGWLDERVTDGLRPVNDWIDTFKQSGISDHEAERLKDDMYRAKGVRDALNSELESAYLNPIIKKVAAIAKANKMDELSAKRLAGYWISGRYAIEKNNSLLKQEHQAMLDAEKALNEANASGDEEAITLANREYRKAERQYRYRKHDVELALDSDEEFQVGTAGGWSNAEAANFMQNIEKHIPKKDLEALAELVYDLNQKRLEIDHQVGRYTEEQYNEYKANRHYVPLTGNPNADDDFESISGAGSNALNVSKDRALKGRKLSEAEDGIDASWRAIGKSTTYAGWADFKNRIDFIYETKIDELVEKGYSTRSAREEVENTLGISKSKMKGLTRSNDDVLIRKVGGEYFEYRLPQKVMQALKNDNVEHANAFLKVKVLSKPISWYARGVTQWTITFAPMNMMRDAWEKSEFIRVQKLYDKEGNLLDSKTMDKIGRAVLKNAFLDKSTWAATKRLGFNQTLRDSGSEGLLKQLLKDGGVSTYSTYLAKTETDLIKKLKAENNPLAKKLEQAGALLEGYNKIFDNVSALSAYKALIDHGVDPKQAAAKTLELTNFRKTGSRMRGIKALYMFSQPTAMGARNLIKYLSTPKGQKRFIGYMAVMMPLYAALRALDDDDEGGNKMDQLGDITRYIPLPLGLDKYFKIPVGFGMPQMAWNFSVNMVKAMQSDMPISEAATNMFVHSMKTFAPISPSEISAAKFPLEKLALTATPTILQPLMQNVLNRSAFGSQITTNFVRDDKLKSEQFKSTTAQFWKDVAVELNDVLGIDMHPEQIKNLFDGYGSMLGSLKELQTIFIENPNREQLGRRTRTPFLNQLIGTTNEFAIQSRYYEASEEAQTLANEYNSRKERGKLEGWLDAEKLKIVKWHERNKKLMANTTKEKSKLTRQLRSGTINANVYEARLKVYNQKMDVVQRTLLNQWREMQGLNTTKSR